MSCTVLDIELADKNNIKYLGVSFMVLHKDFLFVHQSLLNPINKLHGTQVIYVELCGVAESWIWISSLLSFTT